MGTHRQCSSMHFLLAQPWHRQWLAVHTQDQCIPPPGVSRTQPQVSFMSCLGLPCAERRKSWVLLAETAEFLGCFQTLYPPTILCSAATTSSPCPSLPRPSYAHHDYVLPDPTSPRVLHGCHLSWPAPGFPAGPRPPAHFSERFLCLNSGLPVSSLASFLMETPRGLGNLGRHHSPVLRAWGTLGQERMILHLSGGSQPAAMPLHGATPCPSHL